MSGAPRHNGRGGTHGSRLRLAVVGLGYWGPNLVRVLEELPDVRTVVACDRRPDLLVKLASRYPTVRLTTDFEDVLRRRSEFLPESGFLLCVEIKSDAAQPTGKK